MFSKKKKKNFMFEVIIVKFIKNFHVVYIQDREAGIKF